MKRPAAAAADIMPRGATPDLLYIVGVADSVQVDFTGITYQPRPEVSVMVGPYMVFRVEIAPAGACAKICWYGLPPSKNWVADYPGHPLNPNRLTQLGYEPQLSQLLSPGAAIVVIKAVAERIFKTE